jgi:hypothetical protein
MVQFNKILFWIFFFAPFLVCIHTKAADLYQNDQYGDKESVVNYMVSIATAPNEVTSLGFEVRYDPSVLKYIRYTAGHLVYGFDFFNANNASPGILRIGGFVAAKMNPGAEIREGTGGIVVYLEFHVIGHNNSQLTLTALKDDIKNWTTKNGQFTGDQIVEPEPETELEPKPVNELEHKYET